MSHLTRHLTEMFDVENFLRTAHTRVQTSGSSNPDTTFTALFTGISNMSSLGASSKPARPGSGSTSLSSAPHVSEFADRNTDFLSGPPEGTPLSSSGGRIMFDRTAESRARARRGVMDLKVGSCRTSMRVFTLFNLEDEDELTVPVTEIKFRPNFSRLPDETINCPNDQGLCEQTCKKWYAYDSRDSLKLCVAAVKYYFQQERYTKVWRFLQWINLVQ